MFGINANPILIITAYALVIIALYILHKGHQNNDKKPHK